MGPIQNTAAPPTGGVEWLLRIEEPNPPAFAKVVAGFFRQDSGIERLMPDGSARTQFKSVDLLPGGPL